MPLLVTPCASITWHAVGDLDEVRRLLEPIGSIGKKRSSGEGHVLRWEITAVAAGRQRGRAHPTMADSARDDTVREGWATLRWRPPT